MPLYEYRCEEGHTFEVVQRMSDDALESCEACASPAQRVMHAPAVHFKGKGFYNTDYGTRNRQKEKEAEGRSERAAKSDAKPDAKPGKESGKDTGKEPAKKPDKKETAAASGS